MPSAGGFDGNNPLPLMIGSRKARDRTSVNALRADCLNLKPTCDPVQSACRFGIEVVSVGRSTSAWDWAPM